MKYGKFESVDQVDFTLPADYIGNPVRPATILHTQKRKKLFLGGTGWGVKEWKEKIYPLKCPSSDFLSHYSQVFNTVELNTTHYRIPTAGMLQKWVEQASSGFKFCPKLPKYLSHSKSLGTTSDWISKFCDSISLFEDRLACCFMQLSPYFGIDKLPILENFLKQFSNDFDLAIEFRNKSIFEPIENFNRVYSLLKKYKSSF